MKEKVITDKSVRDRVTKSSAPFINHLKRKKYAPVDEYEVYSDMAELDLGDGFNAFDEDFYSNL